MKKLLAIGLCLVMCFSFSACGGNSKDEKSDNQTQISSKTYTYKVRAMQGVDNCIYYAPGTVIPNSGGSVATGTQIYVWTKCTTCGDNGQQYSHTIPVDELNFSNGDTMQYTGTDSCWDCSWDKGMDSFMWAVEITRIAEE